MLGGVPGKMLAARMSCLKGGVIANIMVLTREYVRFTDSDRTSASVQFGSAPTRSPSP